MSASDESIQKLTETVNTLAQALAKSEARYRSIEKIYRWMGTGLVAMAAVVFYVGFDFITRVYAQPPGGQDEIAAAIRQLSAQGVPLNLGGTLQGIAELSNQDPAKMQQGHGAGWQGFGHDAEPASAGPGGSQPFPTLGLGAPVSGAVADAVSTPGTAAAAWHIAAQVVRIPARAATILHGKGRTTDSTATAWHIAAQALGTSARTAAISHGKRSAVGKTATPAGCRADHPWGGSSGPGDAGHEPEGGLGHLKGAYAALDDRFGGAKPYERGAVCDSRHGGGHA